MKEFKTIAQIVEQLEIVGYEDSIGHTLVMNAAFIRLKKMAELNYQPEFALNEKVTFEGSPCYISGISVACQSHPSTEVLYSLSKEWNHESTSNRSFVTMVTAGKIISIEKHENRLIFEAKELLEVSGYKVSK